MPASWRLSRRGRARIPRGYCRRKNPQDEKLQDLGTLPDAAKLDALAAGITEADRLSDMVLADAERVSRHAQLGLRRRELDHAIEIAQRATREAEIASSDAVTEFEDLFAGLRSSLPARRG